MEKIVFWLGKRKSLKEYLATIYPRESPEKIIRGWLLQGIKIGIVLLLVIILFLFWGREKADGGYLLQKGNQLPCTSQVQETVLKVTGEQGKNTWTKEVMITVPERNFTEKEMKKWDEMTVRYLDKNMLGTNRNLAFVERDLVFLTQIPHTEILVEWEFDSDYFQKDGTRVTREISPDGIDTEVVAEATWRNWSKKYLYYVHLMPQKMTAKEKAIKEVEKEIQVAVEKQKSQSVISLPQKVGNVSVSYEEVQKEGIPIWVFIPIVIFLSGFLLWEKQKKNLERREEELLLSHPGLVNKIMLLLSAGLTVRKALERLATEYEVQRKETGRRQYVYEEICVTLQEMRDGISESKAIEDFGKRCKLLPYLRFTSVLTQNMKKGAEGMIDILEQESLEAFEQRKERILRLGETAGTKLLFPMILLLGIVMGIIIVPAFMTM